ncbi:MAG TPA: EamA family transporter [Rectinemataceae bacterium]|nr:EamA family transporter [Rectinemataceae bacterium]
MMYVISIAMIVVSNICYNITQKSTPNAANPFAALLVTYLTAAATTAVALLISQQRYGRGLSESFRGVNWTSLLLGVAIIGLELGFLFAFRAGWDISKASLIANILLAIILIPVGVIVYKESFSVQKAVGIALCVAGLLVMNR